MATVKAHPKMETWLFPNLAKLFYETCDWPEILEPVQVEETRTRVVIHRPGENPVVRRRAEFAQTIEMLTNFGSEQEMPLG